MARVTMYAWIWANVVWNAAFFGMAFSEMSGVTQIHESMPPSLKWWWGVGLITGNFIIHNRMFARLRYIEDRVVKPDRSMVL